MNDFIKNIAFLIITITISLFLSLPKNSKIISYNQNYSEDVDVEFVSNFYNKNNFSKNFIQPVVKINFEIETNLGKAVVSSGTGFSIHYDKKADASFLITNNHVCESAFLFPFSSRFFYEGTNQTFGSQMDKDSNVLEIINFDEAKDLCLMRASGYIKPAKIAANNKNIIQGMPVIIVGAPNGIFPIITRTYLSNLFTRSVLEPHMQAGHELLLLSSQAYGGHSGSPIYNINGEVIGVVFISLNNQSGPILGTLGIHLNDLQTFISQNLRI
jgi:S1-C subfamily serine protease